jgi:hypothetical protein
MELIYITIAFFILHILYRIISKLELSSRSKSFAVVVNREIIYIGGFNSGGHLINLIISDIGGIYEVKGGQPSCQIA